MVKALAQDMRASVLTNLGYVCLKLELYDEAVDYLNQAVELASENMKVKTNLAIAFYKKGAFDKATTIFRDIIDKTPEIITPYIYLPLIHLKQGDSEASAQLFV